MTKGIDVASYQGFIDFDALKADVEFLFTKASEGTGYRDPTFTRNWSEAKRVGLLRGAYHFARPDLGTLAHEEAAYFLSSIAPVDAGDLLALDYEVNWDGDVVGWCKVWLDLVKQMTGIAPYIYLNLSLVRGHDWTPVIAAGYPLWLAYYDGDPDNAPATPWPVVAIKQWTSDGTAAGVPAARVDVNTAFVDLGGEDVALREEFEEYKKRVGETLEEMKRVYNPLYHHFHFSGDTVPKRTTEPLIPPVDGAEYSGSSADLSQVMWRHPDGTMHTYVNGKEV
jgi:GH25 family lysozyme M1 (1,4-beta-N-acetylmuramidase)